jgi:GT2 family glycosyltransferase
MTFDLTISIVLYESDKEKLRNIFRSISQTTLNYKLYLIDNSPTDELRNFAPEQSEYIFNGKNLGFGKAHNIAIKKSLAEAPYHLVLNPDVFFAAGVLEMLFEKMERDLSIGLISPKILYPVGETQHLCKLLPSPVDLFARRFLPQTSWLEARNRRYELIETGYNFPMNIPFLSGCFMFIRTSVLKEVGFFDERIFMYIEDADLTRRIHRKYKTMFYPDVKIFHHYAKGSYKNRKLMLYNIHGAIVYFFKWGWFFDSERKRINKKVIKTYIEK